MNDLLCPECKDTWPAAGEDAQHVTRACHFCDYVGYPETRHISAADVKALAAAVDKLQQDLREVEPAAQFRIKQAITLAVQWVEERGGQTDATERA